MAAAPGWYPDPSNPSRQRYFNGQVWTENYAPSNAPAASVEQPAKKGLSTGGKIAIGIAVAVMALIVVGSFGNSGEPSSSSASEPPTSASATTSPVTAATTESVEDTAAPPEPAPPAEPEFTRAQENAIAKAESYLDYSAFSKQGLVDQLVYDDFDTADATFAVDHIEATGGVDWHAQAAKKAESYLEYSSFSLSGLVDQLQYDGFTPEQAQHGAGEAYNG